MNFIFFVFCEREMEESYVVFFRSNQSIFKMLGSYCYLV